MVFLVPQQKRDNSNGFSWILFFSRKAAARQIVEAFKQTYDADELIENVIVVIEKLVKDEGTWFHLSSSKIINAFLVAEKQLLTAFHTVHDGIEYRVDVGDASKIEKKES